jgi:heme exporter protein D
MKGKAESYDNGCAVGVTLISLFVSAVSKVQTSKRRLLLSWLDFMRRANHH